MESIDCEERGTEEYYPEFTEIVEAMQADMSWTLQFEKHKTFLLERPRDKEHETLLSENSYAYTMVGLHLNPTGFVSVESCRQCKIMCFSLAWLTDPNHNSDACVHLGRTLLEGENAQINDNDALMDRKQCFARAIRVIGAMAARTYISAIVFGLMKL